MSKIKHKTHFYVDANGNQLGGFGDGAKPKQSGAVKVGTPPKSGLDTWDAVGGVWIHVTPAPTPAPDLTAAIQALIDGDLVAAQAAMDQL